MKRAGGITRLPLFFRAKTMGARPNLCFEWRGCKNPYPSGWRLSKPRLEEEYQKGNIIIKSGARVERRQYLDDYKGTPRLIIIGRIYREFHGRKTRAIPRKNRLPCFIGLSKHPVKKAIWCLIRFVGVRALAWRRIIYTEVGLVLILRQTRSIWLLIG